MNALAVIAGVLLVLMVALDVGAEVLHPTISGPVSHRLSRRVWRVLRRTSLALNRRAVLGVGGPVTTIALLTWWLLGLWVGFGLIFWPWISHFSASTSFGHRGLFAALYASGTMLTTLGLGDLLPTGTGMRVAVICEAAAGVAIISAAISYILSVYPVATQNRVHALLLSDLELRDPQAALEYLEASGDAGLADIHERLIAGHQNLRRFPVLYYFHPGSEDESLLRLLHSAVVLCAIARWTPPDALTASGRRLADALRRTLLRIARDYETRYIAGASGQTQMPDLDAADVRQLLTSWNPDPGRHPERSEDVQLLVEYLRALQALLAGIAQAHLEQRPSLFTGLRRPLTGT